MLETYEGKVTVDITKTDDLTRRYLMEFKEKLNEHIEKLSNGKTNKRETETMSNRDYHKTMINR